MRPGTKKRLSDEERFMNFVIPEPNSGCWIWLGGIASGYGAFRIGSLADGTRQQVGAHRFSCEMHGRKILDKMQVLHHCDNKVCVNPDHLYIGTASDNGKDAWRRGQQKPRDVSGENNANAKLTLNEAIAIRMSNERNVILAKRYSVTPTHIGYIKSGKNWK